MIRYSLLVLALIQFGPPARVAPFTAGTPGGDYSGGVAPRLNGFGAYWLRDGELWSEPLAGSPPRPDPSTAHSLGVYVNAFAETVNGPIVVYSDGGSAIARVLNAPESAPTVLSAGVPEAIECNATRCLVSIESGNTLAVIDTNAQLVSVLPKAPAARYRTAWATDPNGFLFLANTSNETRAISIDNSGNTRADVKIDRLPTVAAAFNGDRYAIFQSAGGGPTAFTMTVDGQLSASKSVTTTTLLPVVAAWNGSEYVLAGLPNNIIAVPEVIPPNALIGLRIGPDLTPISDQPFQITPSDGANYPTSIAWNGSTFYVVWTHTIGSPSTVEAISTTVEGAAISANGDVVARDLVSWGSIPQTKPRVARGAQSVVVWSELDIQSGHPTLRYSILGTTFTAGTGTAIDVVPLGEDYLIVWQDSGRTRAAILTSDLTFSEVALPLFSGYSDIAVAANRDHWLIAGSMGLNVVTVDIAHDGTVSPPTVVAQVPYVVGLASDGDHFFLAAPERYFILDAAGSPIIAKQPHGNAFEVDFAGGVYGALSGLGTLDRYDSLGNFIGSTKYAVSDNIPTLSHIGSRFVIIDGYGPKTAQIVGSDGTLVARDVPVPTAVIARSDSTTSTAVETRYTPDAFHRQTPALFVESVTIVDTMPHRAVKH